MLKKLAAVILAMFFISGCATTGTTDARKRITYRQDGNDVIVTVDNKILFDLSNAELRKEAGAVLDVLVSDSLSRTTKNLHIEGHTDIRGTEANNMKLSKQRAETVKTALVARGIISSRITTEGLGSKQPVIKNAKTEDEHEQNRRAVIRIKNERVENVRSSKLEEGFNSLMESLGIK